EAGAIARGNVDPDIATRVQSGARGQVLSQEPPGRRVDGRVCESCARPGDAITEEASGDVATAVPVVADGVVVRRAGVVRRGSEYAVLERLGEGLRGGW